MEAPMTYPAFDDVEDSYDRVAGGVCSASSGSWSISRSTGISSTDSLAVQGLGPVCDLGCGPGHVARYLNERGVRTIGVDLSAMMVEEARRRNPGIEFRQGNMLLLDIEDGHGPASRPSTRSSMSLEHEIAVALAEMKRVLRPGGLLLLAFHVGDDTVHLDEWWGHRVSVDFLLFRPERWGLPCERRDSSIEEILEREPYPDVEHQSRRCYILAQEDGLRNKPVRHPGGYQLPLAVPPWSLLAPTSVRVPNPHRPASPCHAAGHGVATGSACEVAR